MLNNIKFARLISYISSWSKSDLSLHQIECIEECVKDIINPPTDTTMTTAQVRNEVDTMFSAYAKGQKIEAIKAYRTLTGYGLKESKDAIEQLIRTCHDRYNPDTTIKG